MTIKKTKTNKFKIHKGGSYVKQRITNLEKKATSLNFKPQGQGIAKFGKLFDERSPEDIKKDNNTHTRNEDLFFREIGRPITNYNKNSRSVWETKYLDRVDKYIDKTNKASGLSRYQLLKRGQRRMNNNLYKTRAILERTQNPNWKLDNRNNKFDRMFTMTRKQLKKIQNNPDEYLKNPNNFMQNTQDKNVPSSYIGRI